jgi:UDP-glucose 4-epimerase
MKRDAQALRGAQVVITGGAGMLGSAVARLALEHGADVTVIDAFLPLYGGNRFNLPEEHERLTTIEGDIRDAALMRQVLDGADWVFNLAAQVSYVDSNVDPFTDLDINCRGHLTLLEACRLSGRRPKVVFASSRFVYGTVQDNPVNEKHPFNCLSIYGIHKLAGEKYHRFYYDAYGIPAVSLRIANPYGPRQQMKHEKYGIVNWFIRLALEGKPLSVYGDGAQVRDYIYVDDLAEAFLTVAADDRTSGETYNLGSGVGSRFREMAEIIAEEIPGTVVQSVPWPPDRVFVETGDYVTDLTKLSSTTGWKPQVFLREGIARTIAFYRQHRARYW